MDPIRKATEKFTLGLVPLVRALAFAEVDALAERHFAPVTAQKATVKPTTQTGTALRRKARRVLAKPKKAKGVTVKMEFKAPSKRAVAAAFRKVTASAKAKPAKSEPKTLTTDQQTVLRAMASLGGRPSAKQIEAYTGMPNGNVGRALAQLREIGRVKSFGVRQKMTYGLVSTGSVGPRKRKRTVLEIGPIEIDDGERRATIEAKAEALFGMERRAPSLVSGEMVDGDGRRYSVSETPVDLGGIRDDWGYESAGVCGGEAA